MLIVHGKYHDQAQQTQEFLWRRIPEGERQSGRLEVEIERPHLNVTQETESESREWDTATSSLSHFQ
jgi:putative SOS response-associated peptidase YedK